MPVLDASILNEIILQSSASCPTVTISDRPIDGRTSCGLCASSLPVTDIWYAEQNYALHIRNMSKNSFIFSGIFYENKKVFT